MKIAILGAGNGGQAAAGHLALSGHSIRLYDRFREVTRPLEETKRVVLTGAIEGEGELERVTSHLGVAIEDADLILVTVPGFAFEYLAREMVPYLEPGQIVILHPGGTGGAFEVRRVWKEAGLTNTVLLGATETLVYACRLQSPGKVDIRAIKNRFMIAGLPDTDTPALFESFRVLYPQVIQATSVLETSFANTNPIMHPPIMLLNARNISDDRPAFDFYGAGVSPAVARVIDGLDDERVEIARALQIPTRTHHEWVHEAYGLQSEDTATLCHKLAAVIYKGLESPAALRSRYLTEDVPLGLVPFSEFARVASVETPVTDAIIDLASAVCDEDFRTTGRTLDRMGLDEEELTTHRAAGNGRSQPAEVFSGS